MSWSSLRRTALTVGVTAALVAPMAAYAGDSFSDVPDSNIFHDDIDWMAENGVTAGCGGDRFCPDGVVTREQMSAFMRRLDSQDVFATPDEVDATVADAIADAAPSGPVDADTLDGRNGRFYEQRVAHRAAENVAVSGDVAVAGLTIDVPASGTIVLDFDLLVARNGPDPFDVIIQPVERPDDSVTACSGQVFGAASGRISSDASAVPFGGSAALVVTGAGSHTFVVCADLVSGLAIVENATITATWFPAGTATSSGGSRFPYGS